MKAIIGVISAVFFLLVAFIAAPPFINRKDKAEQVVHRAIFGDIQNDLKDLCGRQNARNLKRRGEVDALDSKDIWGTQVNFQWKNEHQIELISAGPDRISGTKDDVILLATCGSDILRSE